MQAAADVIEKQLGRRHLPAGDLVGTRAAAEAMALAQLWTASLRRNVRGRSAFQKWPDRQGEYGSRANHELQALFAS